MSRSNPTFKFSDFDGRDTVIPLNVVEQVCFPSGRVHDHGGVRLISGRYISFQSDSTAQRLSDALAQEAEG